MSEDENDALIAYKEAVKLGKEYPQGESQIAKSAYYSLEYAFLIKKRFKLGEKAISKSPQASVLYAKYFLQGRFKAGEKYIAEYPYYTCAYIAEVLKGKQELSADMHRIMLKNGVSENDIYWVKEYFKYCEYLQGLQGAPYWINSSVVWDYGKVFSFQNSTVWPHPKKLYPTSVTGFSRDALPVPSSLRFLNMKQEK